MTEDTIKEYIDRYEELYKTCMAAEEFQTALEALKEKYELEHKLFDINDFTVKGSEI